MIRNFQNGDIVTHGDHFVMGKNETQQAIIRRLRLFLGEYFLDIREGTPWFQNILGKSPRSVAETNLRERILSAQGVVALTRFEFNFDEKTRKITVYIEVIDIYNENLAFMLNEELI